jgi:S-DNA-T family DNA segregation ATPase FtsK/SpoIIIE
MLEPLPHVGAIIAGEDTERVARLLRMLRDLINERAEQFSTVNASSIGDFRRDAGRPDEPRVILLLDGLATFRQSHDLGSMSGLFEILTSICADGRQVGVHVVVTADRPATVPSALNSLISRRLVLRMADDNDLSLLSVPAGVFTMKSPPGRGFLDGHEIQVAVLGGDPASPVQANAIARFARAMRKNTTWPLAADVLRLPEDLRWSTLPETQAGRPVFGMVDEDLSPATFAPEGTFVIVGPPASGRTTALGSLIHAAVRARPETRVAVFTTARRPALDLHGIKDPVLACGQDEAAEVATQLTESLRDAGDKAAPWVIALESPAEFLNGAADMALQDLLKTARNSGHFAVAEGETQSMSGSWPLLQAVRFSRRGLALQPDQTDGDMVFKTTFPRVRRADFVQGRGMLVGEGRARRVQVAWSGER